MAKVAKIRYSTMEDTFLRIKDLKVRIRRRPEAGTPLLLINGLGACLEAWEPLTKRLPGRDIIAVDHPGTGLSSPPKRCSRVDLPEPLGPVMATKSPRSIDRESPSTAFTWLSPDL